MRNLKRFYKLVNNCRTFMLKRFDTILVPVKFIVKIFPSLTKNISAVTILRILSGEHDKFSTLMVDKELNIDCSTSAFNQQFPLIDILGAKKLKDLSLKMYYDLLQYLEYFMDRMPTDNKKDKKSIANLSMIIDKADRDKLPGFANTNLKLDMIDILNLSTVDRGKSYIVDPDSFLYRYYAARTLVCVVEIENFVCNSLIIKLHITMTNDGSEDDYGDENDNSSHEMTHSEYCKNAILSVFSGSKPRKFKSSNMGGKSNRFIRKMTAAVKKNKLKMKDMQESIVDFGSENKHKFLQRKQTEMIEMSEGINYDMDQDSNIDEIDSSMENNRGDHNLNNDSSSESFDDDDQNLIKNFRKHLNAATQGKNPNPLGKSNKKESSHQNAPTDNLKKKATNQTDNFISNILQQSNNDKGVIEKKNTISSGNVNLISGNKIREQGNVQFTYDALHTFEEDDDDEDDDLKNSKIKKRKGFARKGTTALDKNSNPLLKKPTNP